MGKKDNHYTLGLKFFLATMLKRLEQRDVVKRKGTKKVEWVALGLAVNFGDISHWLQVANQLYN